MRTTINLDDALIEEARRGQERRSGSALIHEEIRALIARERERATRRDPGRSSVWIDHLHKTSPALAKALEAEDVVVDPIVIGELACDTIRNRRKVLDLLAALPSAVMANETEALRPIERYGLVGKCLGYIDVHLLASAMLTKALVDE